MSEKEEKTPKVFVAIYDADYRIKAIKEYPISEDGSQLRIKSGGSAHWMPEFDENSYLEFPSWKRYGLFGPRTYKRVYIVAKKGAKCVNFKAGTATGPSAEQLKRAVGSTLVGEIGKNKDEGPKWYHWATLIFSLLTFMLLLQISGVM